MNFTSNDFGTDSEDIVWYPEEVASKVKILALAHSARDGMSYVCKMSVEPHSDHLKYVSVRLTRAVLGVVCHIASANIT